jgi:hypothetical protein
VADNNKPEFDKDEPTKFIRRILKNDGIDFLQPGLTPEQLPGRTFFMRKYGYLSNMRNALIRIVTEEPDFSAYPEQIFDWSRTCYGDAAEETPTDAPRPLCRRQPVSRLD